MSTLSKAKARVAARCLRWPAWSRTRTFTLPRYVECVALTSCFPLMVSRKDRAGVAEWFFPLTATALNTVAAGASGTTAEGTDSPPLDFSFSTTTMGSISPSIRAAELRVLTHATAGGVEDAAMMQDARTLEGVQNGASTTAPQTAAVSAPSAPAANESTAVAQQDPTLPLIAPTPNVAGFEDYFQYFATPPAFADPVHVSQMQAHAQGLPQTDDEAAGADAYGEHDCATSISNNLQTAKKRAWTEPLNRSTNGATRGACDQRARHQRCAA